MDIFSSHLTCPAQLTADYSMLLEISFLLSHHTSSLWPLLRLLLGLSHPSHPLRCHVF